MASVGLQQRVTRALDEQAETGAAHILEPRGGLVVVLGDDRRLYTLSANDQRPVQPPVRLDRVPGFYPRLLFWCGSDAVVAVGDKRSKGFQWLHRGQGGPWLMGGTEEIPGYLGSLPLRAQDAVAHLCDARLRLVVHAVERGRLVTVGGLTDPIVNAEVPTDSAAGLFVTMRRQEFELVNVADAMEACLRV